MRKTGRNTHQKFDYFQEHGILERLRPFQRQLNVAVLVDFPGGCEHDGNLTTLVVRVRFIDCEQPASIKYGSVDVANPDRELVGEYPIQATDNQGWGAAKAQTYGKKFALQKFLGIPTEELPEAEGEAVPSTASGGAKGKAPASEIAKLRKALQDAQAAMPAEQQAKFQQQVKGQLLVLGAQTVSDLTPEQLPGFQGWVLEQTARGV